MEKTATKLFECYSCALEKPTSMKREREGGRKKKKRQHEEVVVTLFVFNVEMLKKAVGVLWLW